MIILIDKTTVIKIFQNIIKKPVEIFDQIYEMNEFMYRNTVFKNLIVMNFAQKYPYKKNH